jgi:hypothetical protein
MAQPPAPQAWFIVGIGALIAWRLYARVRRSIGRQRLSRVRPWITLVVFPTLVVLFAVAARTATVAETCLAGGLALGVGLGVLGMRLTRFEVTPEGLFYTPSAHLGIALSALLVGRLLYRFALVGLPGAAPQGPSATSALTPLTLLIFGTLAGYYWTYAVGLLHWSFRRREPAPH